jgi:hypothetical protein
MEIYGRISVPFQLSPGRTEENNERTPIKTTGLNVDILAWNLRYMKQDLYFSVSFNYVSCSC